MKKLILILLLFAGCTDVQVEYRNTSTASDYKILDKFIIPKERKMDDSYDFQAIVFEYEHHEYMIVYKQGYEKAGLGVIHLESCKCKKLQH